MLDGHAALKGAAEAVPNDTIIDVAIVFPDGTTAAQLGGTGAGAVAGGLLGSANAAGGLAGVGSLAAEHGLEKEGGDAASVVLALWDSTLYLLGGHRIGALASFKNLTVIASIPRANAKVETAHAGIVHSVKITDSASGQVYEYEAKPMGSGLSEFTARLQG